MEGRLGVGPAPSSFCVVVVPHAAPDNFRIGEAAVVAVQHQLQQAGPAGTGQVDTQRLVVHADTATSSLGLQQALLPGDRGLAGVMG